MRTTTVLFLAAGLVVSACGGWSTSRANPTNWFGSSSDAPVETADAVAVNPLLPEKADEGGLFSSKKDDVDTRVLLHSVTGLRVERTPSGAIIYAEGLGQRQGAYNVQLTRAEAEEDKGVISFAFRADYPSQPTPAGSEISRTVRAAASLTHQDLAGVKLIRVTSASNARETRRR